jgi:hypothetical protein
VRHRVVILHPFVVADRHELSLSHER